MIIKLLYKYYLSKSLLEVYFSSLNSKSSIFFLYIKLLKIPHFLAIFFPPLFTFIRSGTTFGIIIIFFGGISQEGYLIK